MNDKTSASSALDSIFSIDFAVILSIIFNEIILKYNLVLVGSISHIVSVLIFGVIAFLLIVALMIIDNRTKSNN